jgi:hypothetical protein
VPNILVTHEYLNTLYSDTDFRFTHPELRAEVTRSFPLLQIPFRALSKPQAYNAIVQNLEAEKNYGSLAKASSFHFSAQNKNKSA